MAVAYQTQSSLSWLSRTTAVDMVFTKPTGLAAGDLMLVIAALGSDQSLTPPTDWVEFVTINPGATGFRAYWKTASADDAAAVSFTFELSGTSVCAGIFYRIDGQDPTTPIIASNGSTANNTKDPSITGITPAANCLIIQGWTVANAGFPTPDTISGYAITTSDPTWSERLDIYLTGSIFATATASRPEATDTGNFTCHLDSGDTSNQWRGMIIAVQPPASGGGVSSKLLTLLGAG